MRSGRLCAVALATCLMSLLLGAVAVGDEFSSLLETTLQMAPSQPDTAIRAGDSQALARAGAGSPAVGGNQAATAPAGNDALAMAAWAAVQEKIPAPPPESVPTYVGESAQPHEVVADTGYTTYDDGFVDPSCGEGCTNHLWNDVCNSCAIFCNAGIAAGVEATFLAPYHEPDQSVILTDGIKEKTYRGSSHSDLGGGLRTWVGLQRCGWGIRFQYWYLHTDHIKVEPALPTTAKPTLEEAFLLKADVFDVELTQRLCVGVWEIDSSFGGRHARLERNSTVLGYGTVGNGVNLYGLAVGANEMEGTGFTFSLGARKPIFGSCGWHCFFGYRGSLLWADATASALTEATAITQDPVGSANSRDTAIACKDHSEDVCISEFQVGLQYECCLSCVPATVFFRAALEYQHWDTGDLYAATNSYAYLEGGYPEFAGRVDANSNAHDGDLDLIGLALRIGLDY